MIAKVGDIYSIWNEEIQKWCLVQVIKQGEKKSVALIDIDYFSDHLPTEEDLINLKPLIIDHHFWKGDYNTRFIGTNIVPKRVKFIVNKSIILDAEINSYSASDWDVLQPILQYQWDHLPKNVTMNFKQAIQSKDEICIGDRNYKVNKTKIWINSDDNFPINELHKLPALLSIDYNGESNELIKCLEKNPLITELDLKNHQQKIIDISKTNIQRLIIDCSHLEQLILNEEIRFLSLTGDYTNLEIEHPLEGKFLELSIKLDKLKKFNLSNLKSIFSSENEIVDFKQIVEMYPYIEELKIWGKPGVSKHFKSIEKLSKLKYLQLMDLFEMDENDVLNPNLLSDLEFLWLTSVPKEFGQLMKKQFKHVSNLSIRKLRNDKWLIENINNPFRNWEGREGMTKTNAKKAFNAFKKLNTAVLKNEGNDVLLKAFIEFIDVFNKMEEKLECIHTMEREEIYEIYMDLASKTSIEEQLFDIFEAQRIF